MSNPRSIKRAPFPGQKTGHGQYKQCKHEYQFRGEDLSPLKGAEIFSSKRGPTCKCKTVSLKQIAHFIYHIYSIAFIWCRWKLSLLPKSYVLPQGNLSYIFGRYCHIGANTMLLCDIFLLIFQNILDQVLFLAFPHYWIRLTSSLFCPSWTVRLVLSASRNPNEENWSTVGRGNFFKSVTTLVERVTFRH